MDDLEAQIHKLMLEKKAKEAQEAEEESDHLHDYMEQDAMEHTQDAMQSDSDGNPVSRFKRILKVFPKQDAEINDMPQDEEENIASKYIAGRNNQ
jgi:hypothetical protein